MQAQQGNMPNTHVRQLVDSAFIIKFETKSAAWKAPGQMVSEESDG
jgi:hypothetical protein